MVWYIASEETEIFWWSYYGAFPPFYRRFCFAELSLFKVRQAFLHDRRQLVGLFLRKAKTTAEVV